MDSKNTLPTLAKALSVVFHPVLMPVYLINVLIFKRLLLPYSTALTAAYFTGIVILNILVIPAVSILLFDKARFWREGRLSVLREKMLPMSVMIACYSACLLMISHIPFAFLIREMLIAGICCLVLGLIVTPLWKISLYMIAHGAFVAFVGILIYSGAGSLLPVLPAAVAAAACTAWARLRLDAEDIWQTAAGFLSGFTIAALVLVFL